MGFAIEHCRLGNLCLCRILQYSSKFVSWAMAQRGLSEDLVLKIKALERFVSTARKCESVALLSLQTVIGALLGVALDHYNAILYSSSMLHSKDHFY